MLLNLLVIHFAFGSPFGVYQITRGGSARSARSAATVAAYFVLWPIFAVGFVRDWLITNFKTPETDLEQKISDIRTQIEYLAFSSSSTTSVFEFREVFARFTGLSMTLMQDELIVSAKDLLKVSGNKNVSPASACLARRNGRKLLFHRERARAEFVELISGLAEQSNNDEVIELSMQLSDLVGDRQIAAAL